MEGALPPDEWLRYATCGSYDTNLGLRLGPVNL
jgi:hypothetical protein